MTDHYPAEIHIGGPIPRTVLDELVKQIVAARRLKMADQGPHIQRASLLGPHGASDGACAAQKAKAW